ncbi:MAG TPA: hypothetical protein VLX92_32875 [Kofleriaceae bacterium]|nr:hypothetical protein [Kofleriaceae bacterium]
MPVAVRALGLGCLASAVACGPSAPPELDGLTDQVAQVGTELRVDLDATSKDGGKLAYAFKAPDVKDLAGNAEITVSPDGEGVFRWTPLAADLGSHPFDFTVSEGSASTTVTINIDVKSAIGSGSAPVFRQPLGSGTTVDLAKNPCVDVQIVIDDQAAPDVTIAQQDPVIDGAKLTQTGGQMASWHWCPTADQQQETRYTLVLSADDGTNPKTIKDYLIVLRDGNATGTCPGDGPTISHAPEDQTTRLDLAITAEVTDALGLKDTPLLYYTLTDPGPNPDVTQMIQLSTTLASGDASDGTYTASVPNPVASQSDGTSATIYYVLVADDYDQAHSCGHTTQSPVYAMTVTAGGSSTAGLCQPCSADAQCGDGNECVYVGDLGDTYCLSSCDAGCADGYTCSSDVIYSVDGAAANQCVPQSGSCEAPTGPCIDDSWEVNDSRSDASANPVMAPDSYDLVSCPSTTTPNRANDDWFKIVVDDDAQVDLYLVGDGATDLDLHLYHSDGTVVDASTSTTADEELHECLPAATYYIKVNGYGDARSEYALTYDATPASCE